MRFIHADNHTWHLYCNWCASILRWVYMHFVPTGILHMHFPTYLKLIENFFYTFLYANYTRMKNYVSFQSGALVMQLNLGKRIQISIDLWMKWLRIGSALTGRFVIDSAINQYRLDSGTLATNAFSYFPASRTYIYFSLVVWSRLAHGDVSAINVRALTASRLQLIR